MSVKNETPTMKPSTRRRILLITGGIVLLFGIYLMAFLLPDFVRTLSGAESMTLSRANEIASDQSAYVTITDARWDCDTITYIRGRSSTNSLRTITRFTEVFVTDPSEEVVMYTQMSGEMTCADFDGLDPIGYLTRMSASTQQALTNEARLARYFNVDSFLEFCGYCGQDNSMIGAIFGIIISLIGVGLLVFAFRLPAGEKAKMD